MAQTKPYTVTGLSRDVSRIRKIRYYNIQFGKMTNKVTGEATGGCVTYYGAIERNKKVSWVRYSSPTALCGRKSRRLLAESRHFHFDRQYGTCTGTIYALDTNITV